MEPTNIDNNSDSSKESVIVGLDYALLASLKEVEVDEVSDDENILNSQLTPEK
jgi:hypothetical protein